MKCIQKAYPTISLETLIQWATVNGAEFLGIEKEYGSIELGKKANVIALSRLKEKVIRQDCDVEIVCA
jgi:Imidazolonepropionase and related amidohydrolases